VISNLTLRDRQALSVHLSAGTQQRDY